MELVLAILVGTLFGSGVYLMLRRSLVKMILGILLISNSINLLIFFSSRTVEDGAAFTDGENVALGQHTDPLSQALILTAIVIGLGISAFTLILKYKYYKATGTEDLDQLKETD
jgi:multicomponent Na+:H+ antiporter subunit C